MIVLAVIAHALLILFIVRLTATRVRPPAPPASEIVVRLTLAQPAIAPPPPPPPTLREGPAQPADAARHPHGAAGKAPPGPSEVAPAGISPPGPEPSDSTPAGSAPPLSIDSASIRGVVGAMEREETVVASRREPPGRLLQKKQTQETVQGELENGVKRAVRPDCRNAYASLGLIGLPLLLFDTATDHGCKW